MAFMEINTCPACKVPEYITIEHVWINSGLIAQKRDRRHVVAFIESDNLDSLFRGIEQIIGISIDKIVMTARRRASRAYMDRIIPKEVKELLRKGELDLGFVINSIVIIGQVLGYGHFELVDYRYEQDEDDYAVIRVEKPYSVVFGLCDPIAALEAVTGYEVSFDFEEISKDTYEISAFRSSHPTAFKDRLIMKSYRYREGDIVLDACATCGAPSLLSSYEWDLDKGIILSADKRRRMAFFAPNVLDVVLDELEKELGEIIPNAVIEAQRRFTKTGIYNVDDVRDADSLRTQLALRGLGNLRQFDMDEKGASLRLDNAAIHLIMVGLIQGIYEMVFGVESRVEWELTGEGNLEISVIPGS
jgi:hypothetical protein